MDKFSSLPKNELLAQPPLEFETASCMDDPLPVDLFDIKIEQILGDDMTAEESHSSQHFENLLLSEASFFEAPPASFPKARQRAPPAASSSSSFNKNDVARRPAVPAEADDVMPIPPQATAGGNFSRASMIKALLKSTNRFRHCERLAPKVVLPSWERETETNHNQASSMHQANDREEMGVVMKKPKRSLSAYNLFFKCEREKLLKQRTQQLSCAGTKKGEKLSFANTARCIAARWRVVDSETKLQFEYLAALDSERYEKEMLVWKKWNMKREMDEWRRSCQAQQERDNSVLAAHP